MKAQLKRFLAGRFMTKLLATLALAVGFTTAATAETPVAVWTDFSNPTSGDYTLVIDGSCIVGRDGSVTIGANGGLTLSLPEGNSLRTGGNVTIVADVENLLPDGTNRTIFAIKDSSGNLINLTKGTDGVIRSKGNKADNDYGNIGNVSTIGKAQLAYAYGVSNGTDAWVDEKRLINNGSLHWSNRQLVNIYIGSYDGTTQVMEGLKIKKLAIYASKLTAVADICPTAPNYHYKFNGNNDASGASSLTFSGENKNSFSASADGFALRVIDGNTHPWGSGWNFGTGSWTVTTIAKPVINDEKKIVIWTTGNKSGWFGLLAESSSGKAVLAAGNADGITTTICEVSVSNLNTLFHVFTVRYTGNNTYELIVDGDTTHMSSATYATTIPSGNYQIGAVQQGSPTGLARTTGTLIDDLRIYQRAMSNDEVKALSAKIATPETISINIGGGRGTGDLAANSDHLVQTNECMGLAAAVGAAWNNLAKQWQSGSKFTMAAGTVKATDGTQVVVRDSVAVNIQANNTYDGGATRANSFHKGYLDDGDYDSHKSYVKVTGIPYPKYSVIVYAATDSNPSTYGNVKVNGTNYTWKDGVTKPGTDGWGDSSVTTTEYGKNALIVQNVCGATLEIEGTKTGGRGGIAAVQIVDAGAPWPEILSVNFGATNAGRTVNEGTDPGALFADTKWYNFSANNGTAVAAGPACVTYTSKNTYQNDNLTKTFNKGYLDDGNGDGVQITVSNLENGGYDVAIYCGSDNANKFTYKTVNGVNYTWDAAEGKAVEGTAYWGDNAANPAEPGGHSMVVRGVNVANGTLTIGSIRKDEDSKTVRGCISALQLRKLSAKSVAYEGAIVAGAAQWSDKTGIESEDTWSNDSQSTITLANTAVAEATLTFDENVKAESLTLTSEAGKNTTLAKGANVAMEIASYDFSAAAGKTTVTFDPGAANVKAGVDTVLDTAATGNLTIGADKKLTVKGGALTASKVVNSGTLNFAGGTEQAPIAIRGDANFGTVTLAANTYVKTTENSNNHKHVVTGQGATSYYMMMRDNGGSPGMADGTVFSNLILVSACNDNNKVWLERTTLTDGTVGLKMNGPLILNNSGESVVRSVSGSKALTRGGSQTLKIRSTEDAVFTGSLEVPVTIDAGSAVQTLAGAYTQTLTVNEGGKVKLTGNANPSAVTDDGTVYFGGDAAKTYANVISGTGAVVKEDANTVTLTGANTYSGGTTVNAGTLEVTTPNGSYAIAESGTLCSAQDLSQGATFAKFAIASNAGAVRFEVTLSKADVQAETPVALADLDESIVTTDGFAATVINADTGNAVENALTIENHILYVTPQGAKQTHVVTPEESGNITWAVGTEIAGKRYRDYDDITFATTAFTNAIAVPSKVAATTLTFGGTYNLAGSLVIASVLNTAEGADVTFANDVVADSVIVTNGTVKAASIVASEVALTNATFESSVVGPSMRFVRLSISATQNSGQQPAVGEFRLYRGNAAAGYTIVDWPVGTKISDSTGLTATKETADYPGEIGAGLGSQGGNECQPGDLIDGFYGNKSTPKCYGNGAYNTPAYNKWWPTSQSSGPWMVTIEFPYPVAMFSGCNFCLADHAPRNPTAWTIEVSADGENWTTVNETTEATWSAQYDWAGANENVSAFLNTGTTPTEVAVGGTSTIVADGSWTAALAVGGTLTLKGVAEKHLTLDAASTSSFASGAKLRFDLSAYSVTKAGKQYVVAGPLDDWPAVTEIEVVPENLFTVGKDDDGYYVEVQSGTYWLGGAGAWNLAQAQMWTKNASSTTGLIWLNGAAANFTRSGTVTIEEGVVTPSLNFGGDEGVSVTFTGAMDVIAGLPINVANTNDTITFDNASSFTPGAITTVADANLSITKTGAGELTLPATVNFGGGALTVSAGTVKLTANDSIQNAGAVTVAGTLDLNGRAIVRSYTLAEGGALVNNGGNLGDNAAQMNGLELTGDATVGGTGNFGILNSSWGAATLTLDGHTLTKTGAATFWLCNVTADNGTINVVEGTVDTTARGNNPGGKTTIPGTLNLANGTTLSVRHPVTVGTLTGSGTVNGGSTLTIATKLAGTANVTATLAFTDGATLDLTQNATTYAKTFTADGTLNVDVTGRTIAEDEVIISWTTKPAATINVIGYTGSLTMKTTDTGLVLIDEAKRGAHTLAPAGESANWTATGFNGDDNYRDPSASATFADGTASATAVTIDGTRTVGAFVIDNADTTYTFNGGNFVSTTFEKKGTGTATLKVLGDTHPGAATVTAGTLVIGTDANDNTYKFQAGSIVVKDGATLDIRSRDAFYGTTNVMVEAGAVLTTRGFNVLTNVTISGGTIETAGGFTSGWRSWCLTGSLTATGNAVSYVKTAETTVNDNYGLQLATGIFDVEEGSTLDVATPLQNGPGDRGSLPNQVRKTGAGEMVVRTNPTYTGATDVQAGTYTLACTEVAGKAYTVAEGATLNVGTVRGLTITGPGSVTFELTKAERRLGVSGEGFQLYTPGTTAPGSVKVTYGGKDITRSCTFNGGRITYIRVPTVLILR